MIDEKQYYEENEDVTWETSTIRTWLNEAFYNEAFSEAEKNAISETIVENEDNIYYGTEGGNNTTDKVYLLSLKDIVNKEYGFPTAYQCDSKTRIAEYTDGGTGYWWLRSPGDYCINAACVNYFGSVDFNGILVANDIGVRPALHINLSSLAWTKGEEVVAVDREVNHLAVMRGHILLKMLLVSG